MRSHAPDFQLNRPGALIAALPAVLGFVPEKSLVLVTIARGEMGCVLRMDLSDNVSRGEQGDTVEHLAEVAAAARPDSAVAVVVDADGARCPVCNDEYRRLTARLAEALLRWRVELIAVHVVDRIAAGGRWHCVDGCGAGGAVDDPAASPVAVAAVLDGRRLYARRSDLQQVIAVEDRVRTAALADAITAAQSGQSPSRTDADDRADIEAALRAAKRVARGRRLTDAQLVRLAGALTRRTVRDTLYALAVGALADQAEALWGELARTLPDPWRVEALVLLAFSAYARGDGPLAGVSLEAALRSDGTHRMASMLDTALQSGMRPEQIRELAATGYRLARRLGVTLPPRRVFGRAG